MLLLCLNMRTPLHREPFSISKRGCLGEMAQIPNREHALTGHTSKSERSSLQTIRWFHFFRFSQKGALLFRMLLLEFVKPPLLHGCPPTPFLQQKPRLCQGVGGRHLQPTGPCTSIIEQGLHKHILYTTKVCKQVGWLHFSHILIYNTILYIIYIHCI